jgi:sporulation protein YqfC
MSKSKEVSNKIKRRFAEISDLPEELTLGLSKMVFIGNNEFWIENYKGIIEYENNKIRLGTIIGNISVEGENLNIEEISEVELIVRGKIKRIEFESEG